MQHPKCGIRCQFLRRRDWLEGGSGGGYKASEGNGPLGGGNVLTTPPSLPPQPTPAHYSLVGT